MSFDDYIFQASVNIAYIIFQQGTVIVYQKYFFVHDVYSVLVTIYFFVVIGIIHLAVWNMSFPYVFDSDGWYDIGPRDVCLRNKHRVITYGQLHCLIILVWIEMFSQKLFQTPLILLICMYDCVTAYY